ncbi:MAG: zinc metalloprotease HtpX [Desulfobacterales bacterium]|nr:zinc metalloprotease HtpX [Desulfobacterales bacterium]MBS3755679.1 zinc metalloprotease HtpX [Desulfobacterales bacterium]
MGNQIRTTILLAVLTVIIMAIGRVLGGTGGMVIALLFAGAMNFFSYWYSDKIVLKKYKAREVDKSQAPELYDVVAELTGRAGLPMPRLCVIPQQAPNAFATGRNPDHAVVAVTEGLLRYMNRQELSGVIAHELGHVKNRDILIGSIAATLAGAIMLIANFARWAAIFGGFSGDDGDEGGGFLGLLAMSIVAPIAAVLVQAAISRSREYLADSTSANITGNPEGLASALEKLDAYTKQIPIQADASTAHMFTANPVSGRSMMQLFSTHPPIADRVSRLLGGIRTTDTGRKEPGKDGIAQAERIWDQLR